jgi:hypothetical protein
MKIHWALIVFFIVSFLAGCTPAPTIQPTSTPAPTLTATLPSTPTSTATRVPTPIEKKPLTIVFYGNSALRVGKVGNQGQVGFSFVDNLRPILDPKYNLITANYGGETAKWGYENLAQTVLGFNPDVVTLVWGWDDLYLCSGIFDPETNTLLENKLDAYIQLHIQYLKLQIDVLLDRSIEVLVVTPLPSNGDLPWDHQGPNNEEIWDLDHRCAYNIGVERLVEAQRQLVMDYSPAQRPVFLVDIWQIYMEHPNSEKMYMDIMHPGSYGSELIAEGWLQVFKDSQIH